jgi:1,4-dihydroxy-2-naphthoate octaprenyltransferase
VLTGFFTPVMLVVFLSAPLFARLFLPVFLAPKPQQRPDDYPADSWPLWFVASAFVHNRRFGLWFLLGLVLNAALVVWILK